MNYEEKFFIHAEIGQLGYGVYRFRYNEDGTRQFLTNQGWSEKIDFSSQGPMPQPLMFIPQKNMQQFVDAVKDGGFSPSQLSSISGELITTKKHLEDMRTLVFDKNPINVEVRQ